MTNVAIIIPARYESSRFPGKPMAEISGKSLLHRTVEAAREVKGVHGIHVATDDNRIVRHALTFEAIAIETSSECRNGTERVAEAADKLLEAADLIINLQGDAPLTPPWFIEALIDAMIDDDSVAMATPAVRLTAETYEGFVSDRRAGRVGGTTVVFDTLGDALYFSKEVIPYLPADAVDQLDTVPVYHHVGVYAYRPNLLQRYM
ncbi:MAG: 3-deoxy-manno-octulosonate cytidylyltransferase, partial [Gammaproteobacteria bacterium]|nr:3-deoxy-manno-octulosonate cytidylyltransferase [Gammaproteobacteria bacterium]